MRGKPTPAINAAATTGVVATARCSSTTLTVGMGSTPVLRSPEVLRQLDVEGVEVDVADRPTLSAADGGPWGARPSGRPAEFDVADGCG